MKSSEFTQLSERILALGGGGKGDDTVWDPFVGTEDRRLRVLANKRKLLQMVVLHAVSRQSLDVTPSPIHQAIPAASR